MSGLKRLEVKYIRDKAKSLYTKDNSCYICGETSNLELHHYNTLTALWNNFKKRCKADIQTKEDIEVYRDQFISTHRKELYEEVVTLCKSCHKEKLHKIYGKAPTLATAKKQMRWADIQREKHGRMG